MGVEGPLNTAPCGFLVFTNDGRIIEANATLLELLAYASKELIGKKIESILTVASAIFYQTHFFPLLALNGKAEEIFITLLSKHKQDVPMLAYANRNGDSNQCIFVPVRQRQKYEEEILAARRAAEEALQSNKELIAASKQLQAQSEELDRRRVMSEQKSRELLQVTDILFHDLREPLRKIESFANLLSEQKTLAEQDRMYVEKIDSACRRMSQLLRALQEFVSVEAADDRIELVHMLGITNEAYQAASATHGDVSARFETEPIPVIEGYSRQLQLMFLHFFDNAFKFRRADTELVIRIRATVVQENRFRGSKGRYQYVDFLQLLIEDNGIGISSEYSESVFQLLRKLDINDPGTGCGLAICRKVVENHFGSITLIPKGQGGAGFKILLPMKHEHLNSPQGEL